MLDLLCFCYFYLFIKSPAVQCKHTHAELCIHGYTHIQHVLPCTCSNQTHSHTPSIGIVVPPVLCFRLLRKQMWPFANTSEAQLWPGDAIMWSMRLLLHLEETANDRKETLAERMHVLNVASPLFEVVCQLRTSQTLWARDVIAASRRCKAEEWYGFCCLVIHWGLCQIRNSQKLLATCWT